MKALRKRVISLGLVMTMILAMIPFMAFTVLADETTPISFDDCDIIGFDDVREAPIFYYELEEEDPLVVELTDLADLMEDGMISAVRGCVNPNQTVYGTNEADLTQGYSITLENFRDRFGDGLYEDECESLNFDNLFVLWIIDDDDDEYILAINAASGEEGEKDYSFTAYYEGQELTDITYEENAYSYFDYMKGETFTVGVYTIKVPNKAEAIDLKVASPCLHYNYTADGTYLGGWVKDSTNGDTEFSAVLDYGDDTTAADGVFDYIQIQSPYDAAWNSTLYYCITFDMDGELPPKPVDTDVTYAFGSEWEVIAQARSGQLSEENAKAYYLDIMKKVTEAGTAYLSENPTTDNARVVLALTAAGFDATNVAGYNLLDPLADLDYAKGSYITNAVYALIAIDSHDYGIPACPSGKTQTTKEALVSYIYGSIGEDGLVENAWGKDVDSTLMALQSLVKYYPNDDPKIAKALTACAGYMKDSCGLDPFGYGESTCSTSQAVIAATTLGINPDASPLFYRDGKSIVTFVESMKKGNGFIESPGDTSVNKLATQQGNLALVAYDRFMNGKTALYDMSDVNIDTKKIEGSSDGTVIIEFGTPIDSDALISYEVLELTESIKKNIPDLIGWLDIRVTDPEGNTIPIENNQMTIGVKGAEVLKGYETYHAVYIQDETVKETMDVVIDGDFAIFKTTHLSEYGFTGEGQKKDVPADDQPANDGNGEKAAGLQTGDSNNLLLWIVILIAALGGGVTSVLVVRKKRNEK